MTIATPARDEASRAVDRPPGGETDDEWHPLLTIAVSVIVVALLALFVSANLIWPVAFARSLVRWVRDPSVGGLWRSPAGLAIAVPVLAGLAVEGWLAARLLLAGSDLERDLAVVSGLAITLAISILGFGGTVAVVVGRLSRPELVGFLAAVGVVLALLTRRRRRVRSSPDPTAGADDAEPRDARPRDARPRDARPRRRLLWGVTTGILSVAIVFTFAHATLTPVTEWDALAYHAEVARVWYLDRPDPEVRYGPSIGIEISGNYPPLFPAAGAAMYTIVGAFDDLYLRVLPPLLFAALILMVLGYARTRFDAPTAMIAALLVAGSPLTIAYGSWTTTYALLGALLLSTVIVVDVARDRGAATGWIGAGCVAGLAILTHFYGLLSLFAVVAVLATRRPRPWRAAGAFLAVAASIGSVWLLRNLVVLGDPFYPLGTPPFRGKGLEPALWDASKSSIRNAALRYWSYARGTTLAIRLVSTSLFDRQVLLTGTYFGLWYGLLRWRRSPRVGYLFAFLVAALFALLLPGWYWLRALVAIVPVGALLTAALFAEQLVSARRRSHARRDGLSRAAHASIVGAVAFVTAVAGLVSLTVAVAGPGYRGMHAAIGDDVFTSVRSWGSPRLQLWRSFGGDVRLWEWLDEHVDVGERFGTLEIRTYHMRDPDAPLYLDGREAIPLMGMASPGAIRRYLEAKGVRYIAIPGWASFPPTPGMISGILPLFGFLGSDAFPAVAVFPVSSPDRPSVVYSVGRAHDEPRIGLWSAAPTGPPPLEQTAATFPRSTLGNRILVPTQTQPAALTFEFDASRGMDIEVTHLTDDGEHRVGWAVAETGTRWWRAVVPLPPDPGAVTDLDVFVRGADLMFRDATLIPADDIIVTAPAPLTGRERTWTIGPRDVGRASVPLPLDRPVVVSFRYLDRGRGPVHVTIRGAPETPPVLGSWRLEGSGRWLERRLVVSSPSAGSVEMTVRGPDETPVLIRDLRVAPQR